MVVADDLDWATFNATPGLAEMASQGVRFSAITQSPLCGPSRASMLSGKYTHNHGISGNDREIYNSTWYSKVLGNTFGDWCQAQGYRTLMVGKYANSFDKLNTTGWSAWIKPDGRGMPQEGEYWHTTMVNKAVADIQSHPNDPYIIWYSSTIPHGPLIPDNQYLGSLAGLKAPRTPNFNEADISDKIGETSLLPILGDAKLDKLDRRFRLRAEMTKSLIDGINTFRNTFINKPLYVIFISDNGYLQGNHRHMKGKGEPYEESIRVPMFVLGPDISPATSAAMIQASDIAPTVAELCGAPPQNVDGKSITPLLSNPSAAWRNRSLIELGWSGIVTPTRKLVRHTSGQYEVYRFTTDPYELQNTSATVPALETYLNRLITCSGPSCWAIETE